MLFTDFLYTIQLAFRYFDAYDRTTAKEEEYFTFL
jgi:hypothetical protein